MSESEIADVLIIMVNALIIIVLLLIVWLLVRLKIWTVPAEQPGLSVKDATWYALSGIGLTIAYDLFVYLARPTMTQAIAGVCVCLLLGYLAARAKSLWRSRDRIPR